MNYYGISLYIDVIHKFTRDNYAKRFPELESLIHTPMEYIKTVKVISMCVYMLYMYSDSIAYLGYSNEYRVNLKQ